MNYNENFGYCTEEMLISSNNYEIPEIASENDIKNFSRDKYGIMINILNKLFNQNTKSDQYSFDSRKPAGYIGKKKPFFKIGNREELTPDGRILNYDVFACSRKSISK